MNKKIRRDLQQLYLQLIEIYEQMEEATEEETKYLMERETAIEYQIIDLKAESCL